MSNLPTEFYWIGDEGFHRTRITTTYIGPETKFLERLAKTVPKAFTNLMPAIVPLATRLRNSASVCSAITLPSRAT